MVKTQGFPRELQQRAPSWENARDLPPARGVPGSLVWEALCGISHDYMGQPLKGFKRSEGNVVRLVLGLCPGDWGRGAAQCLGGGDVIIYCVPTATSALGLRASGPISGYAGGSDRQRAQSGPGVGTPQSQLSQVVDALRVRLQGARGWSGLEVV